MDTQTEKALITNRVSPCTCGCSGQDPWHARDFRRVIRDIREETGQCRVKAGYLATYERTGIAQFPWGKTRVVEAFVYSEAAGRKVGLGWDIDEEDYYRVINDEPSVHLVEVAK